MLALVLASAGCASRSKLAGPASGFYLISAPTAEFFKYGPAQSFGADFILKKGERVTMLSRDWGFCRVLTENGVAGYVATEDIVAAPAPAPVKRIASTRGVPVPIGLPRGGASSRTSRPSGEFLGNPNDALFNVNDVPMPMPDDPPLPKLRPEFRAAPPSRDTAPEPQEKPKPKFRG